jgi:membrane protease YdiL (CAAX protease family)
VSSASEKLREVAGTFAIMTNPAVPLPPREQSPPVRLVPRWGFGDAAWTVFGGLVAGAVVGGLVAAARHAGEKRITTDGIDYLISGGAQFGAMALLMWLTVGKRGIGLRHEIGVVLRLREAYWILIGMGTSIALGIAALPILQLWDRGKHPKQAIGEQVKRSTSVTQIALVVLVIAVAPIVEEMLFRGVVLRSALRRMSAAPAVLVSGGSFALLHLLDPNTLPGIPQLFAVGVISAIVAIRSGDLGRSIYFHAGFNLLAAIGLLL